MASRKDEKERLRQERIERESADRERKAKQAKARKLAAVVGVVALIAAVVAGVVLAGGSKDDTGPKDGWPNGPTPTEAIKFTDPSEETLASVAKQAKCTVRETPNEGRTHKPDDFKFKYRQSPPTSGNHTVEWADDGAYKKAPPTPKLVHALEHGRVIFWWNPKKVSQANIGTIKKLYDNEPYHLIISPNADMPSAVAATAWDHSLTCPEVNDAAIAAMRLFHVTWSDNGPESVQ